MGRASLRLEQDMSLFSWVILSTKFWCGGMYNRLAPISVCTHHKVQMLFSCFYCSPRYSHIRQHTAYIQSDLPCGLVSNWNIHEFIFWSPNGQKFLARTLRAKIIACVSRREQLHANEDTHTACTYIICATHMYTSAQKQTYMHTYTWKYMEVHRYIHMYNLNVWKHTNKIHTHDASIHATNMNGSKCTHRVPTGIPNAYTIVNILRYMFETRTHTEVIDKLNKVKENTHRSARIRACTC